jgi:hypothetical protein
VDVQPGQRVLITGTPLAGLDVHGIVDENLGETQDAWVRHRRASGRRV